MSARNRVTRARTTVPMHPSPAPDASPSGDVRLRAVRRADHPFLLALYGSVRAPELRGCLWSRRQKDAFIADQFWLQQAHYRRAHPAADYWVVDRIDEGGAWIPIGRLSLDRSESEWHLIELSLLPAERGCGRGTALVRWIQQAAEAGAADAVGLHVEIDNSAAIRLYARAGFGRKPSRFATHAFLRWTPPTRAQEDGRRNH